MVAGKSYLPESWLAALRLSLGASVTWSYDIDLKTYDPADDAPFNVIDIYQIPIFSKYRLASTTAAFSRARPAATGDSTAPSPLS